MFKFNTLCLSLILIISSFILFHLYIHPSNLQESVGGESTHMTFTFICFVLGSLANLRVSVSISIFQSHLQLKIKNPKVDIKLAMRVR